MSDENRQPPAPFRVRDIPVGTDVGRGQRNEFRNNISENHPHADPAPVVIATRKRGDALLVENHDGIPLGQPVGRDVERSCHVREITPPAIPHGDLHRRQLPLFRPAPRGLVRKGGLSGGKRDDIRRSRIDRVVQRLTQSRLPQRGIGQHGTLPASVDGIADDRRLELPDPVILDGNDDLVPGQTCDGHSVPFPGPEADLSGLRLPAHAPVVRDQNLDVLLVALRKHAFIAEINMHIAVGQLQKRRFPAPVAERPAGPVDRLRRTPCHARIGATANHDPERIDSRFLRPVIAGRKQYAVGQPDQFGIGNPDESRIPAVSSREAPEQGIRTGPAPPFIAAVTDDRAPVTVLIDDSNAFIRNTAHARIVPDGGYLPHAAVIPRDPAAPGSGAGQGCSTPCPVSPESRKARQQK